MSIKDFDIFKDIEVLEKNMTKILEGAWKATRPSFHIEGSWHPPVDVCETDKEVVVIMEIAGTRKEDITVSLDEDVLRIRGQRPVPVHMEITRLHQVELDFGDFERAVRLPMPLNRKKITAVYKDGFLRISIAKDTRMEKIIEIAGE